MKLIEIIRSLQQAKGTKLKQELLNTHLDNEVLKAYLKAVYDPAISYYVTKAPKITPGDREFHVGVLAGMKCLADRVYTGRKANEYLLGLFSGLDADGQELLGYIIKRAIGGSVGETMVLNTFPGLFFVPPYMRCAGMDAKVKAEYATMPFFYVQTKMDGQFAYVRKAADGSVSVFTRAGSYYPLPLAEKLSKGLPAGSVAMGELLVYEHGKVLDRKTGNGILNSVLQGQLDAHIHDIHIQMVVWDLVTEEEFLAERSETVYQQRLSNLEAILNNEKTNMTLVHENTVDNLQDAFVLNREAILRGEEGTVWKNPCGIWRNSSSGTRDAIKCKLEFEAEYVVVGKTEGTGKAKGMLGSFSIATRCGALTSDLGSGFNDAQRKEFWEADTNGWIVGVKANDVISKEGRDTLSLFLPIFVERRLDKTEADDYAAVMKALQTAKESA